MNFYDLFKLNKSIINIGGYLKYFKYRLFNQNIINSVSSKQDLLKGKHSNKCYICALGPSLKDVNFNVIDGDTIVVNRFYKHGESIPQFSPNFYLMIDAAFGSQKNKEDFLAGLNFYKGEKTRYLLNSKLSSIKELKDNNNICFVSCCKGLFNHTKDYEIGRVMPAFGNVACTAIAFAIALGYEEIYLLGCDFNSFASRKATHCYTESNDQRQIELSYELYCYSLVADMHTELNKYAQKKGVKIINTTKGSLIDAYKYEINESLYTK